MSLPDSLASAALIALNNEVRCDLCGAPVTRFVLQTPRLDGPLVQCDACGLFFVQKAQAETEINASMSDAITVKDAPPENSFHADKLHADKLHADKLHTAQLPAAVAEMERLAQRARELALVEPEVEAGESHWRSLTAEARLQDLRRFVTHGRLLEVGCSTGEFLLAAREAFAVTGIEADAHTSARARAAGLACINGTLHSAQLPAAQLDVIALYHVIEHLPSPSAALRECQRLLTPGGWLVLEAPNIANLWYRLLGARWRQFIPDHLYFFTPATLTRLCAAHGFTVRECRSVGKVMSVRLFLSRLGRSLPTLAHHLTRLCARFGWLEKTIHLRLGDVMRLYAQRDAA